MIASLVAQVGRLLLAAGCSAAGCATAGCASASPHVPQPSAGVAGPVLKPPPRSDPSPGRTALVSLVPAIGGDPASLARQLTSAERVLAHSAASTAAMAGQARIAQLVCLRLAARPGLAREVINHVAPAQRAAAAADIAATTDLVALAPPATSLPSWRIVPAQKLAALRADYRAAQAATGVEWPYLAAINFVETDFGRIDGVSSAGAQGPMQFLPATWAAYGRGDVHRARNAILAAARFLADHGAPGDMSSAVHAYNPSWLYVDAVQRYASRLRADPGALPGYYDRPVTYHLTRGWVVLPAGYGVNPAVRAVPLGI